MSFSRVYGVGCDFSSIPRFFALLQRPPTFATRLLGKILHNKEIEIFHNLKDKQRQAEFLCSRWALKESFIKAFGYRVEFPELEIARTARGQEKNKKNENKQNKENRENRGNKDPRLKLIAHGKCLELMKKKGISASHCSIAHEENQYAMAYIILETNKTREQEEEERLQEEEEEEENHTEEPLEIPPDDEGERKQ